MGYLPAALRNYLARLGWSQGDKEFFTDEELIAAFDLPAIGRSASRFDFAKLENMNGHFMRAMSDDELFRALIDALPYLPGGPEVEAKLDEQKRAQLRAAMPGLKERAKTLVELLDGAGFLFADAAADDGREGRRHPRKWRARASRGAAAAARFRCGMGGFGARRRGARLCRGCGRKTRRGRPAFARGADRPLDLARHF